MREANGEAIRCVWGEYRLWICADIMGIACPSTCDENGISTDVHEMFDDFLIGMLGINFTKVVNHGIEDKIVQGISHDILWMFRSACGVLSMQPLAPSADDGDEQ